MRPFNPVHKHSERLLLPFPGSLATHAHSQLCCCVTVRSGCWDGEIYQQPSWAPPSLRGLQFSPNPHPWSLPELHCRHPCAWPRTLDLDPDPVTQLPWDLPWHRGLVSWSGLLGGPSQHLQTCPAPPAPLLTSPDCSRTGEASALLALLSHSCCNVEPCAYDTKPN